MGIGLTAGVLLGLLAAALAEAAIRIRGRAARHRPVGTVFQNLLSMVAIPLVATALFAGLSKLGSCAPSAVW